MVFEKPKRQNFELLSILLILSVASYFLINYQKWVLPIALAHVLNTVLPLLWAGMVLGVCKFKLINF